MVTLRALSRLRVILVVVAMIASQAAAGAVVSDTASTQAQVPGDTHVAAADEMAATEYNTSERTELRDWLAAKQSAETAASLTETATNSSVVLDVGVPSVGFDSAAGPNEVVSIYATAVNASGAIRSGEPGVALTIELNLPNGATRTFERTTDTTGTAQVQLDLSEYPVGEFDIRVESPATAITSRDSFFSGAQTKLFPEGGTVEVGRTVTAAVQVIEADEPVAGTTQNVTIQGPDGAREQREVVTNADGVAQFTFTPDKRGRYTFSTEDKTGVESDFAAVTASRIRGEVEVPRGFDLRFGQTARIRGYLVTDKAYANEEISIKIQDETDTVIETINTTTGPTGVFTADWEPPAETADYNILVTTGEDTVVPVREFISVEGPARTQQNLNVDLEVEQFETVPGGTVSATVRVTENGSAVAGETVRVAGLAGFNPEVPTGETTVTTGADGTATVSYEVPETVPTPTFIELQAGVSRNGQVATDSAFPSVAQIDVEEREPEVVAPGETFDVSLTATDRQSGEGVAGLAASAVVVGESKQHVSVVAAGAKQTDATGTVNFTQQVPADADGELRVELAGARPIEEAFVSDVAVRPYSLSFEGLPARATAGESVQFSIAAGTDAPVEGVVQVSTFDNANTEEAVITSTVVTPGDDVTVSFPEATETRFYQVELLVTTADGEQATLRESIAVEAAQSAPDAPTIGSSGAAAKDPDGDGLYEDVNGDGEFNVIDVNVLFDNFRSDAVQNNSELFDFNGDGDVNIIDVSALLGRV